MDESVRDLFGLLSQKVIKCGHFKSTENLKEALLAFINYFNATIAKSFRWTYQGKPLFSGMKTVMNI